MRQNKLSYSSQGKGDSIVKVLVLFFCYFAEVTFPYKWWQENDFIIKQVPIYVVLTSKKSLILKQKVASKSYVSPLKSLKMINFTFNTK